MCILESGHGDGYELGLHGDMLNIRTRKADHCGTVELSAVRTSFFGCFAC